MVSNQSRNEFGDRAFPISDMIFQKKKKLKKKKEITYILQQPEIYQNLNGNYWDVTEQIHQKDFRTKSHPMWIVNSEKATGPWQSKKKINLKKKAISVCVPVQKETPFVSIKFRV